MYASLASSYQWNMMNKAVTNRIAEIMKEGTDVSIQQLNTAFATIKNRVKSPIYNQIIQAINDGRIHMVYCTKVKVPLYLPFVVLKQGPSSHIGVVFLNHCECTPTDGDTSEYNINERRLLVSLESCYISMRLIELDLAHNTKLTSPSIIRPAVKIYTFSIIECMNRKFSIKLNQDVYNAVIFMVSKFFIYNIMGYNPDSSTMENYCLYNTKNADLSLIRSIDGEFEPKDFENIATFITKLTSVPQLAGRIGKLNVSTFVQMYVNLYNAPMTLAMENFSYLVYNIISVIKSTYVNNYHMLKNIVGDDDSKLYG